jgi:hypothetical protein
VAVPSLFTNKDDECLHPGNGSFVGATYFWSDVPLPNYVSSGTMKQKYCTLSARKFNLEPNSSGVRKQKYFKFTLI